MEFNDIPEFIGCNYACDVPLAHLPESIERYRREYGLTLDPDFQRAHVWTDEQRRKYVEYLLRGGTSSRDLYFNCKSWMGEGMGRFPIEMVDGKQRLTACMKFMTNKLLVFPQFDPLRGEGFLLSEIGGRLSATITLKFHINALSTRAEVLQWYLDLNEGGVVHTPAELARVRALLEAEGQKHD